MMSSVLGGLVLAVSGGGSGELVAGFCGFWDFGFLGFWVCNLGIFFLYN